MKKILLTTAAAAMCATTFAGTRMLYQQNFETATDALSTGWTYNGAEMTIASDPYGKYLELSLGQNNGRSGQVTWGPEIFQDENGESIIGEDGIYHMQFDFSVKTMSNNQWNSEITVFTNHTPKANETYRTPWSAGYTGPWDNFLFDLSQCNTAADADMLATINAPLTSTTGEDGTVTYAIDTTDQYSIVTGTWYTVTLEVNTKTREVIYNVSDGVTGDIVKSGEMTVPEKNPNAAEDEAPISMLAEGLYVMTARYQTTMDFDNIKVYVETDYDWANEPTIALTRIGKNADDQLDLNMRAYTITFIEGETLHFIGTDGKEETVEYSDEGFVYETTQSGTIKAYTTCGTATSKEIEIAVDCTPCVLPGAKATISSVKAGYAKSYTLSVSNADVPLQPTIFLNYEFVGKSGKTIAEDGVASGYVVNVDEEGILKITSESFGYQATTVSVENNLEFEVKQIYDFARLSDADAKAAGFTEWKVLNSASTSGFNNWTARKRLYYEVAGTEHENEEGATVRNTEYPFGFLAEDNTTNVLNYSEIGDEEGDKGINVEGYELFPGVRVFANHNVTLLQHIGVCNNSTKGGNNKNIDVLNLEESDFVVANRINNYGGNSCHPVVATTEEYYNVLEGEDEVYRIASSGVLDEATGKYTVSVPVYRIDTACTKITVYKQKGGSVEGVEVEAEGDNYYYTIDGIRVAEPTRPGLYIHNGKKIIVK